MITIRPATPPDVDDVRRLVREAYVPYVSRIGIEPQPMNADYPALVAAGHVRVATERERLVGVMVLLPRPGHLVVENVAVAVDARTRGIGGALLLHAEAYAVALGLREVRLFTHESMTENLAYYARRGFAETHRSVEQGWRRVFLSKRV